MDFNLAFDKFPEHIDFVKLVTDAQRQADGSGEQATFEWRGYTANVAPNLPEFGTDELQQRLHQALKKIENLSEAEKLVIYN